MWGGGRVVELQRGHAEELRDEDAGRVGGAGVVDAGGCGEVHDGFGEDGEEVDGEGGNGRAGCWDVGVGGEVVVDRDLGRESVLESCGDGFLDFGHLCRELVCDGKDRAEATHSSFVFLWPV